MDEQKLQRAREAIKIRISNLQIQVDTERLTPSLREEIVHVIKVHQEALERPNLDRPFLEELDSLQDQIEEHWSRVYKSCIGHSNLMGDLGQYQLFLTELLLSEYTGAPFTDRQSMEWLHQSAAYLEQATTDTSKGFRATSHESIVFPLEELRLNRPHVEKRLVLAAADDDQQRPLGGWTQYLIKYGDWKDLAKYLYYDRELAVSLFKYQPIVPSLFNSGTRDKVLQGITSIQDKYFTNISSPTEYTVSKYAMDLETVKKTPGSSNQITTTTSAVEHHKPVRGGLSPRNHAKRIIDAIAGGIKSMGTHSGSQQAAGKQVSANAAADEKTPLVDDEKKP
ncbi:hypothetical protein Daus18300_011209 [Diaporthe australafricana]|uniref:Uncharacterized protein n=1 Tax=Diaporthe australafricana TaxID=127596 RepID=A0ABR3W7D3_9PEZI